MAPCKDEVGGCFAGALRVQTVPVQPLASFLEGPAHPREAGTSNKPGGSMGNVINWEEKGFYLACL